VIPFGKLINVVGSICPG